MTACVVVPSHISNINRTKLLLECLRSLLNQTIKIPIYLSMSFETELDKILFGKCIEKNNLLNNELLHIVYQYKRTCQFRHIEMMVNNIKNLYKFVMFCDDDDTYEIDRVEKFMIMIQDGYMNCPKDKIFVGVYERYSGNGHSSSFHEYWAYGVKIEFILNFMNILKINNYGYIFDNKFCDVLFATYLRALDHRHFFVSINEKLYNYNRNEYSITGTISKNNKLVKKHVPIVTNNFEAFIRDLNETLEQKMETIRNNIFIEHSMRGRSLHDIMKRFMRENYIYINKIDKTILSKIEFEYDKVKHLCDLLYQHKFT